MADQPWQSRIQRHDNVDPNTLLENPANWRIHPQHQQQQLETLLDHVGWVRHVIVNDQTGHLVDGHLRVRMAQAKGEPSVPVVYVDLTPEEEHLILASLDPIATLAATDSSALAALAASLEMNLPDTDLTQMVRNLAGTETQTQTSPTQDQIDQRQDEMTSAFEGRHLHAYDASCPSCGNAFQFAR
jgi:hypothetical protein